MSEAREHPEAEEKLRRAIRYIFQGGYMFGEEVYVYAITNSLAMNWQELSDVEFEEVMRELEASIWSARRKNQITPKMDG